MPATGRGTVHSRRRSAKTYTRKGIRTATRASGGPSQFKQDVRLDQVETQGHPSAHSLTIDSPGRDSTRNNAEEGRPHSVATCTAPQRTTECIIQDKCISLFPSPHVNEFSVRTPTMRPAFSSGGVSPCILGAGMGVSSVDTTNNEVREALGVPTFSPRDDVMLLDSQRSTQATHRTRWVERRDRPRQPAGTQDEPEEQSCYLAASEALTFSSTFDDAPPQDPPSGKCRTLGGPKELRSSFSKHNVAAPSGVEDDDPLLFRQVTPPSEVLRGTDADSHITVLGCTPTPRKAAGDEARLTSQNNERLSCHTARGYGHHEKHDRGHCQATVSGVPQVMAVGIQVEAMWGRRWYPATIIAVEGCGHVRIRRDSDGTVQRVKESDVRLVSKDVAVSEAKISAKDSSTVAASVSTPLMAPEISAQTASAKAQETGLESSRERTPMPPSVKANQCAQDVSTPIACANDVAMERLLPPGSRIALTTKACQECERIQLKSAEQGPCTNLLDLLLARGVSFISFPSSLLSPDEEVLKAPVPTYVVLSDRDETETLCMVACAVGVTCVCSDWLLSAALGQSLVIPSPHNLIIPKDLLRVDFITRWAPFAPAQRLLHGQTILMIGNDSSAELLITAAGGEVRRCAGNHDSTWVPDVVYVVSGNRESVPPRYTGVPILDCARLQEYILAHYTASTSPRVDVNWASQRWYTQMGIGKREDNEFSPLPDAPCLTPQPRCPSDTPPLVRARTETANVNVSSVVLSHREVNDGNSINDRLAANLPVVEGEDYYFLLPNAPDVVTESGRGQYVTSGVGLGRVVGISTVVPPEHLGSVCMVTLQLYEFKYIDMWRNPRTQELENRSTVYLSEQSCMVPMSSLFFDTPVYVVNAASNRHVYLLEETP